MFPTHFGQPISCVGEWVEVGIALVCAPVWFRGDRKYSARVKEMTLFVPIFSITLCRNAQRSIQMCVMSSLSHQRRTTVLPHEEVNWVTFNRAEAEGEGVSPAGSSSSVCCLQAGLLGDREQPPMWGKHHLGHLLLVCRALRRQTGLTRNCRSAFRHLLNTWDLQELRTSFNTQDFLSAVFMHDELVPRTQLLFSYLSPLFLLHFFLHPLSGTPGNNKELFVWFLLLPLIFWCI